MTQTFYPITPVEVTPGSSGSWQDVDASGSIPSGATGVILHIVNTGSVPPGNNNATHNVGIRKNGSTDDRHSDLNGHCWAMIGVDASRIFEAYVANTTDIDIYIAGYTKSGVTFATNATDKSLGTTGSWIDIDCSTEAPSAVGLIFEISANFRYWQESARSKSIKFD